MTTRKIVIIGTGKVIAGQTAAIWRSLVERVAVYVLISQKTSGEAGVNGPRAPKNADLVPRRVREVANRVGVVETAGKQKVVKSNHVRRVGEIGEAGCLALKVVDRELQHVFESVRTQHVRVVLKSLKVVL